MTGESRPMMTVRDMLHPVSVAVYGASDSRGKFGGRIMHFLIHHGFGGEIVPINPRRTEIFGRPAYARVADAPRRVDVAILAVPAESALAAVSDCAAAGVGCCVIITTGFAEAGADGTAAQAEMLRIARGSGMRIVGPNCMGFLNPGHRLALCSSVVLDTERMLTGRIGLASQSGALMVSLLDRALADGIGFSACLSLGNQADVDTCEALEYFVSDPATDVVCVYTEGLLNPPRFFRAAAACRAAGKPLLILKTGKTPAGVKAAQSHTASLAGSYEAFAALCRRHGALLMDDAVIMVRTADMLTRWPGRHGGGVAVISGSGAGLRLAELSGETRSVLAGMLLPAQADNPVDLGGRLSQGGEIYDRCTTALASDADVGTTLIYLSSMPEFTARTRLMADAALAVGKPVLAIMLPGPAGDAPRAMLRKAGCPLFDSTEDALAVLTALASHAAAPPSEPEAHRPVGVPGSMPAATDPGEVMRAYAVPFPAETLCIDLDAAERAAAAIGYPVVLKGQVRGVVHKTELSLVHVGLRDAAALRQAWHGMQNEAFTGGLVQRMVPPGLELLVGLRQDPDFGPMVVVGAGGTSVELLADTAAAPAPLSKQAAERLIRSLRLAPLMDGFRGRPPVDVAAAAAVVARLSWLAADMRGRWSDAEINPLILAAAGNGVCAVDVRATPAPP